MLLTLPPLGEVAITEKQIINFKQKLMRNDNMIEPQNQQSCQTAVSGSTFSTDELHALHSGLIAAKPHLNERTKGYKTTLTLIKKLSDMIAVYYR